MLPQENTSSLPLSPSLLLLLLLLQGVLEQRTESLRAQVRSYSTMGGERALHSRGGASGRSAPLGEWRLAGPAF